MQRQLLFDACVVCALPVETTAFLHALTQYRTEPIKKGYSKDNREYRYTTIRNTLGEPLTIQISWLPRYGQLETALHVDAILKEFRPRFAAMTGVCAGDKQRVYLGDLIVAERAFAYDTGTFINDKEGRLEHQHDTRTSHPSSDVIQWAQLFEDWRAATVTEIRPVSRRQQREWLLNALLYKEHVDDLDEQELVQQAPDWRSIVSELQNINPPVLSPQRALLNTSAVKELRFQGNFPFQDPKEPQCYIAPLASGNAVRRDNPFAEIRTPVHGTLAIDMEGAAFYRALESFTHIRFLLAKAVADYADSDKDDSYYKYASQISALYALSFIKEYVNSQRMPYHGKAHNDESPPLDVKRPNEGNHSSLNSIGTINAANVTVNQAKQIMNHSALRKKTLE